MHFFHRDCKTETSNVFNQTDAISKRKKIAIPDWCQMKVLSDDLRFKLVFVGFIGKISYPKVRFFSFLSGMVTTNLQGQGKNLKYPIF